MRFASFLLFALVAGCAHRAPAPVRVTATPERGVTVPMDAPPSAVVSSRGAPVAANEPGSMPGWSLLVTADDRYTVYLDGQWVATDEHWASGETYALNVTDGTHVLAVLAEDQHAVIAGFRAAVYYDGQLTARTGDGSFVALNNPPSGFEQPGFDDSAWPRANVCRDMSPWGRQPANLEQAGAAWVWSQDCRALGITGFRLELKI